MWAYCGDGEVSAIALAKEKKATPFQPTDMTIKNVIVNVAFLIFSLLFPSFLPPLVLTRELNFCATHLSSMQNIFCTV